MNRNGERPAEEQLVPLIRRGTAFFIILMWILALLTAAVTVWLILARSQAEAEATAEGLEQYARRNIELGDFVADELIAFLDARGGIAGIGSDPVVAAEMNRLNRRLPGGSAIIFVLPTGWVAASTTDIPPSGINLSDRRWYVAHTQERLRVLIGPAIHSRVTNRIIFTYTKSYYDADGKLQGIINLGIPSDSLIGLTPNATRIPVALVHHDGSLVAAQPVSREMLGKPFALPGVAPQTQVTRMGSMMDRLSIITVKNLPEYQLYAVAAVPLVRVLEPAFWSILLGAAVLGVLSWTIVNLSHLAERKSHEVEQALADNKVLFQEVHHRVKNNLQVISSLIRLQTDRLPEELRPLMEQTAARVRAIAMVHEQIYTTSTPSVVQLDRFLEQLLQQLETSMLADGSTALTAEMEPLAVGLDHAVPVALLATEAITNAIKHGTNEGGGAIAVALRRDKGNNVLLVTNGGGALDAESRAGLGSRIMTVLARQIDGSWSLEPEAGGGTRFTLTWPALEMAGSKARTAAGAA